MNKVIGILANVVAVALILGVIVLLVAANNFNAGQDKACEDIGMTWVKEAPWGEYGCAILVPVPEGRSVSAPVQES